MWISLTTVGATAKYLKGGRKNPLIEQVFNLKFHMELRIKSENRPAFREKENHWNIFKRLCSSPGFNTPATISTISRNISLPKINNKNLRINGLKNKRLSDG
jgi:hypothetical protein